MKLSLAEHACTLVDEFAKRRGADGKIAPVTSAEVLQALGHNPRAGKNLGNAVALLDAACLTEDLPWVGRLIIFKAASDDFVGPWLSWAPFKPYIVEGAPRQRQWLDEDFARVRNALLSLPLDPRTWWNERKNEGDPCLLRAVLVVLHQAYDLTLASVDSSARERRLDMKKASTPKADQDIPEYTREQLGFGVRGKYAARYAKSTNVVVIDPALTKAFPNTEVVNEALRGLLALATTATRLTARQTARPKRPARKRAAA